MALEFEVKEKSTAMAYLLSPWFRVNSSACLNISAISLESIAMKIYMIDSLDFIRNESLTTVTEITLNNSFDVFQIEVPLDTHFTLFEIEAQGINKVLIDFVQLVDFPCGELL